MDAGVILVSTTRTRQSRLLYELYVSVCVVLRIYGYVHRGGQSSA